MTKKSVFIAAALMGAMAISSSAQASSTERGSGPLVAVWENVWAKAGSFFVATADQAAPAYDATQWTKGVIGTGTGGPGTCESNRECDDADACTTDVCDPNDLGADDTGCVYSAVVCDDSNACTTNSCDAGLGCVYPLNDESPACGGCEDGIDNDDDGDIDSEDCSCATLCAQQRFAVVTTFVPNKLSRYALYFGSDVTLNDPNDVLPFPTGGVCVTNGDYRAGVRVGLIAATGSSRFGKGSSFDPDFAGEEGLQDIDTGSDRVTYIRTSFSSDGDPEVNKDIAPYVGSGTCSNDAMIPCIQDADCGVGNDCENQLLLDNVGNVNVDRTGTVENFTRCVEAQATVAGEATQIAALAGTVAGLKLGNKNLVANGATPLREVVLDAGLNVIYVRSVRVAGKTVLRFTRDPLAVGDPTVVVVRVARSLRLGGEAEVQLDGIDANNVIWNVEGAAGGRPKFLRSSHFRGTVIAADRRGVGSGGTVTIDGAIKARRLHLGQGTVVNHVPFTALLP